MAQLTLPRLREPSVIPGFGVALGFAVTALSLIVLIPLAALVLRAASIGPAEFWSIASDARDARGPAPFLRRGLHRRAGERRLSACCWPGCWCATTSLAAASSMRMVDLPFALPTAVAGIALAAIYAPNGIIGSIAGHFGLKIAFTPLGVVFALIFIGLPFVVRTVQPILEEVERDIEEAAALLGASRLRTVFQVVLPHVYPALLTGFALAFARGVGEYGSVIFIAGNIPMVSEIAPLLIVIKLEEFDYGGATVIATVMLAISFAMLFLINKLQAWSRRRLGNV